MEQVVLLALIISAVLYLYIGYKLGHQNKGIGDLLPIVFGKNAKINSVSEFSSSTAATTISLATIILAYFELASSFGLWLLWTAFTTGIGMLIVSSVCKRIWTRMGAYDHRPSMHEFIGVEYNSPKAAMVASVSTSIGFLLIFATELIVGSKFLAKMIPAIPEFVTIIFLSGVGFAYTLLGGFRAVIKTDQMQMRFIWILIAIIAFYYCYFLAENGGIAVGLENIPEGVLDLSWQPGLGYFLLGIAVMNIPLQISNMSLWQRISGAQKPETIINGLKSSVWSVTISWTLLALLACFAYMIVPQKSEQGLLTELLITISRTSIGKVSLFFITLGLYGAMLSTASTNLIVVTHTLNEDIFAKFKTKSLQERIASKREFFQSRIILLSSAIIAIILVEGLKILGFSIADLAFSIYGSSLALFPPIIFSLYLQRKRLKTISVYATTGIILGFLTGWCSAIVGKIINNGNLIFLAPSISIGVSFLVLYTGYLLTNGSTKNE